LQLSQLIKRLNPEELATLLDRHGIVEEKPDVASIANKIVQRSHFNAILSDLNQAQILILRWLAHQDGLQASWDDFIEAVGDRAPEAWLLNCLEDMRLSGLADFAAEPGNGWVSTYPAVGSAQPISQGIDLNSVLSVMPTETLERMCQRFAVRPTPMNNGKRIEGIARCLSDHHFLVFLLASLSPGSLELFEWFLARGGTADHNALATRLGNGYYDAITYASRATSGWGAPNIPKRALPLVDLLQCALVAGVSGHGSSWGYASYFAIPTEVSTAYAGVSIFDSAPMLPPKLESADPKQITIPNLTTLLRDLSHLRAFISLGRAEWRQDGGPYTRSLQGFNKLIKGPKDYGALLWRMALEIPVIVPSRDPDRRYDAADLSADRPDTIVQRLLDGWLTDRGLAYYDYYLPKDTHKRVLITLRNVPTDAWIVRESFENFLSFFWPLAFTGTVKSRQQGIGNWSTLYSTVLGRATDEQGRELFQAQEDGMDIAFSVGPDAPAKLPAWDASWVVQPDRTIMVPPNAHPDSILDAWKLADLLDNQGASIFRVSADSISGALNRGLTPDQITELFAQHSRTPLPATIERLIRDQSERYGQVRVGRASAYLQVEDPDVLNEIVNNAKLNKIRIEVITPTVAVVQGVDDVTTLANLRRAGYLPISATDKIETDTQQQEPQSQAQIKRILQQALDEIRLVKVRWQDTGISELQHDIEPEHVSDSVLRGYLAGTDDMYQVPLGVITAARLLTDEETRRYL